MLRIRTAHLADAPALYAAYQDSPDYFARLGTALPTAREVEFELGLALMDPRRHLELIERVEPVGPAASELPGGAAHPRASQVIGLLDWKEAYPEPSDVTINLLLLGPEYRGAGLGTQVMRDLERRVPSSTTRLIASVLGEHPTGVSFWEKLDYTFAIDARPAMTWYAKPLAARSPQLKPESHKQESHKREEGADPVALALSGNVPSTREAGSPSGGLNTQPRPRRDRQWEPS